MKSSLLLRLKPLVLLIAVPLLLTNCATEDAAVIEAGTNANELRARLISLDEVKQMPKVMEKLTAISQAAPSANMRTVSSSKYKFSIDTDKVLLIEKDNYQSLTFPIHRDVPNGYLENLFLHPHNGKYLAFLFRYSLTQTELAALDNGTATPAMFENLTFTPLDDLEIGDDINVSIEAYGNGGGYSPTPIYYNGKCWLINHVWENEDGEEMWDMVVCPGCSCSEATNPGSGGGSPAGPNAPGFTQPAYLAIWDIANGGGGGVSTGGSWGGGGGGGNGGYNPFNPPVDVDPAGGLITAPNAPGLYNGNPVIGIVSPSFSSLGLFLSNLTPEQMSFWNNQDNEVMVQVIKNYLSKTSYFGKNGEVVRQMIGYLASQESSDDSILSVEQIIDFLGDTPTEEQLEQAGELLDFLAENGGTVEVYGPVGTHDSIDFEDLINEPDMDESVLPTYSTPAAGQKISSYSFSIPFFYAIDVNVLQEMNPYSILSVNTELTGFVYARGWQQNPQPAQEDVLNGTAKKLTIIGYLKTYVTAGETILLYSSKNTLILRIDKSDGHIYGAERHTN